MTPARRRLLRTAAFLAVPPAMLGVGAGVTSALTGLPLERVAHQSLRLAVAQAGRVLYGGDLAEARELARTRGILPEDSDAPAFVFERDDAPHLVALREKYRLDEIIAGASSEYEAQLKLAAWVGTRFDHGTDDPPGGRQACDTIAVIEAGQRGARYWCEVAAYTMIHAAQAAGWHARLVTGSTNGYTWDHAVAELWSRQFNKWFVVDADFNVVFESAGVPLSAWELVHDAPALRAKGVLMQRQFARFKKGLVYQDLLRLYAYAHVDQRSDWCTRRLRRGSPAGGDLNTLWTAREGKEPRLTAIRNARSRERLEPRAKPTPAARDVPTK